MYFSKTVSLTASLFIALFLLCIFSPVPALAQEHEDEHDDHAVMETTASASADVETMKALVAVLQQLLTLLQQQVAAGGGAHEDEHETLHISVGAHDGRTHIHVHEPGKEEVAFFLDAISTDDHEAIIDAVMEETGFSDAEVRAAIEFPAEETYEEGDEHTEDEHSDDHNEYEGIHIMSDGTVMLGSGDEVEGATVTDDGMIMLSDGHLIEPEYDLR